jgi:hypothetical protein
MATAKSFAMFALKVAAVLVLLHYVAPAAAKAHTGTA